jgi:hypothetical protein
MAFVACDYHPRISSLNLPPAAEEKRRDAAADLPAQTFGDGP